MPFTIAPSAHLCKGRYIGSRGLKRDRRWRGGERRLFTCPLCLRWPPVHALEAKRKKPIAGKTRKVFLISFSDSHFRSSQATHEESCPLLVSTTCVLCDHPRHARRESLAKPSQSLPTCSPSKGAAPLRLSEAYRVPKVISAVLSRRRRTF